MFSEGLVELNSQNVWRFYFHPWSSRLFCYGPHCCVTLSALHMPPCKDGSWSPLWNSSHMSHRGGVSFSLLFGFFWGGGNFEEKGNKELGSREPLVVGDEATVGNSWGADGSGSSQGSRVKGTQISKWWKSSVTSLCSCTTLHCCEAAEAA